MKRSITQSKITDYGDNPERVEITVIPLERVLADIDERIEHTTGSICLDLWLGCDEGDTEPRIFMCLDSERGADLTIPEAENLFSRIMTEKVGKILPTSHKFDFWTTFCLHLKDAIERGQLLGPRLKEKYGKEGQ